MKKLTYLLLVLLIVPVLAGCPGNTRQDKEVQVAFEQWIRDQDANGWEISGYDATYQNIVVDIKFRPTRLQLAIIGDAVNPWHQRNLIEDIIIQWRNMYPANIRPRFKLRLELYNLQIDRASDLGWTEIDTEGMVDTHHSKTQDVI